MIKDLIIQHKFKISRDGGSESVQDYIFQKLVLEGSYRTLRPGDITILSSLFKDDNRLSIIESYAACYVGHFFKVTLNQALVFMGCLSDRDTTPMLPKLNYTNATLPEFTRLLDIVHRKYPDSNTFRSMLYLIHERVKASSVYDNNFIAMDQWIAAIVTHPFTWDYFQHLLPFDEQLFVSFDETPLDGSVKKDVGQWMGHAHSSAENFQKWEMVTDPKWNKGTYSRLWHAHTNGFKIDWHPHYDFFIAAFTVFNGVKDIDDGYFSDASTLMKKEDNLYLF